MRRILSVVLVVIFLLTAVIAYAQTQAVNSDSETPQSVPAPLPVETFIKYDVFSDIKSGAERYRMILPTLHDGPSNKKLPSLIAYAYMVAALEHIQRWKVSYANQHFIDAPSGMRVFTIWN